MKDLDTAMVTLFIIIGLGIVFYLVFGNGGLI